MIDEGSMDSKEAKKFTSTEHVAINYTSQANDETRRQLNPPSLMIPDQRFIQTYTNDIALIDRDLGITLGITDAALGQGSSVSSKAQQVNLSQANNSNIHMFRHQQSAFSTMFRWVLEDFMPKTMNVEQTIRILYNHAEIETLEIPFKYFKFWETISGNSNLRENLFSVKTEIQEHSDIRRDFRELLESVYQYASHSPDLASSVTTILIRFIRNLNMFGADQLAKELKLDWERANIQAQEERKKQEQLEQEKIVTEKDKVSATKIKAVGDVTAKEEKNKIDLQKVLSEQNNKFAEIMVSIEKLANEIAINRENNESNERITQQQMLSLIHI